MLQTMCDALWQMNKDADIHFRVIALIMTMQTFLLLMLVLQGFCRKD